MKSILKLNAFQIHLFFANKFLPKITVCLERDCRMIPPFRFCIYNEISTFPTLASGASIARGRPRIIGQKPNPLIRRGTARKSLPPRGRGTAIAVDEVFTMKKKNSSSVSLRLPPSPTGEGFFHAQKAKKSPEIGRAHV